jgi:hypothetical protein
LASFLGALFSPEIKLVRDNLGKSGSRCGCISSTDHEGRQFWVVAAERENAGRFIVYADEKLMAFMEFGSAAPSGGIYRS